jgi:serine/threonine protein kinase
MAAPAFKKQSILDFYAVTNVELGSGANGVVCLRESHSQQVRQVRDLRTGRLCALKCLLDTPRARREATIHQLCAPCTNIVQVIDIFENVWESAPHILLVMEKSASIDFRLLQAGRRRALLFHSEQSLQWRPVC